LILFAGPFEGPAASSSSSSALFLLEEVLAAGGFPAEGAAFWSLKWAHCFSVFAGTFSIDS
jgi:hypothetical protein